MSIGTALLVSTGIIVLSAFFVAIEFALVAARRHRLEEAAGSSASARAALRSSREISLLLAGSQLGITLCTLALGAIAKPAVHDLMVPLLAATGAPDTVATVVAFVLSLLVVTFLHLVVGEMAPKSWAIAHPERSAILLALPMRAFMWLTRPALVVLNGMANWSLQRVGVQPVDEMASGHTPEDLRQLLDHSAEVGALDPDRRAALTQALELTSRPLRDIVRPTEQMVSVRADATVDEIRQVSVRSGHLRLVVRSAGNGSGGALGLVHTRDALAATPTTRAVELMRPVASLQDSTPIHAALGSIRDDHNQVALVRSGHRVIGLVTLQDLLEQLVPSPTSQNATTG